MQYAKNKSVSKEVLGRGPELEDLILKTLNDISNVVGSTLGPGGMSVVIERQEEDLAPLVTKDGVTVFKNLGFDNSSMQVLMEAARDAAVRTAIEAGDGTTTATILAAALVEQTMAYCERNPKVSPQRVVRSLEKAFREILEPSIRASAKKASLGTDEGRAILRGVAKVSANGDSDLAEAVLKCFDLCGDEGNVTLIESSGPSSYEVEHLEGYPIGTGYEESCGKLYQAFINNQARQMLVLDKPLYILYHGRLSDLYSALDLFTKIGEAAEQNKGSHNVVLVATGFSETVIGHLAVNFTDSRTPNIYPLVAPISEMATGQYDFLRDLAAITGGTIFDPLNAPLETAELHQLGSSDSFEASRYRSTVLGYRDEILVYERVDELKTLIGSGTLSIRGADLVTERLGKLTGGIAKLKIVGASAGELREKRDRAEDAICAVRGTIKHGALPGGGKILLRLATSMHQQENPILKEVLSESLLAPVYRLFSNAGFSEEEAREIMVRVTNTEQVYDLLEGSFVDPFEVGLLDSVPAVLEALRNSLSIASLLGTCGGVVVFKRDRDLERSEAKATAEFLRNANINEADERG